MKVRFMFDVFVDGRFVAREESLVVVLDQASQVEALNACLKKADQLAWYVADAATDPKAPLSRDRVSFNVQANLHLNPTALDYCDAGVTVKL